MISMFRLPALPGTRRGKQFPDSKLSLLTLKKMNGSGVMAKPLRSIGEEIGYYSIISY